MLFGPGGIGLRGGIGFDACLRTVFADPIVFVGAIGSFFNRVTVPALSLATTNADQPFAKRASCCFTNCAVGIFCVA